MKYIFLELVFRSLYIFLFYIGLFATFYLTYGLQLEYACAYFNNHYQCADFCFESSSWQYYEINISKKKQFFYSWCNETFLTNENGAQLHQSKSWSYLSLATLLYFHPLNLSMQFFVWVSLKLCVMIFVSIQGYGLILPGILTGYRLIKHYELILINCIFVVSPAMTLYVCALYAEVAIEPYDSELLFLS